MPSGLMGLLVLIWGIEKWVSRHDIEVSTLQSALARRAAGAARHEARECGILCLGDSQVAFGVIPKVIESFLGRPTYSLALLGGQPPATYYLLRHALQAGARPAALVVDFKSSCIRTTPHTNDRQWAELLTLSECAEMALVERDPSYFAALALCKLCPSYKARLEIRAWVLAAFAGSPGRITQEILPFLRNAYVNQGSVVLSNQGGECCSRQEVIDAIFFPCKEEIHPLNARYMRRFLELAAGRQIPVFWLLPPIRSHIQAGRDQQGYEDSYMRQMYGLYDRFSNLYLVDARHAGFPDDAFCDHSHLTRTGAMALSAALARAIGSVLGGGPKPPTRLVALPRFQQYGLDPPPEDLGTSAIALSGAHNRVRK
jgi:hypothetical protein